MTGLVPKKSPNLTVFPVSSRNGSSRGTCSLSLWSMPIPSSRGGSAFAFSAGGEDAALKSKGRKAESLELIELSALARAVPLKASSPRSKTIHRRQAIPCTSPCPSSEDLVQPLLVAIKFIPSSLTAGPWGALNNEMRGLNIRFNTSCFQVWKYSGCGIVGQGVTFFPRREDGIHQAVSASEVFSAPCFAGAAPRVGNPFSSRISMARSIGILTIPAFSSTHP